MGRLAEHHLDRHVPTALRPKESVQSVIETAFEPRTCAVVKLFLALAVTYTFVTSGISPVRSGRIRSGAVPPQAVRTRMLPVRLAGLAAKLANGLAA